MLFSFDRSALSSRVVEEGDVTEEDEDDEAGWYTLCDLRISFRKQGISLKLVNYKSVMPSM